MTINKYTDRLSSTTLFNLLSANHALLENENIRENLFRYAKNYNDIYQFDQLDNAFSLIGKSILERIDLSKDEDQLIKDEILHGMHEYFISLNHVSEALLIIFTNKTFDIDTTCEVINHIWEAYSCNENNFIEREIEYLTHNL